MKNFNQICKKEELFDFVLLVEVLTMENTERSSLIMEKLRQKAEELGVTAEFSKKVNELSAMIESDRLSQKRKQLIGEDFRTDKNGKLLKTVGNYLTILNSDEEFSTVRYNLLTGRPEWNGKPWDDECFSRTLHIIENNYDIKSEGDLNHALKILWNLNQYHPIRDRIRSIEWDGESRIERFLTEIMEAEDSDYARECSRLIFHCGIARAFEPGCKVDDIIVLQGAQGNGKTTITQWLALQDEWYGRISDIRGTVGIEQIQGKWICEISELLALNSAEKQEEAKQYFDRRSDNYRKPYSIYPSDIPRQCIFIGTTNLRQPFKDKTGNRRYYPVWCNVRRGAIFENMAYIKHFIEQCWAEAYSLYASGKVLTTPKKELIGTVTERQNNALEDDWRVGAIEEYIEDKDCVCVLELWDRALGYRDKPTMKQSKEIGIIMDTNTDWERSVSAKNVGEYGKQRCWVRPQTEEYYGVF